LLAEFEVVAFIERRRGTSIEESFCWQRPTPRRENIAKQIPPKIINEGRL